MQTLMGCRVHRKRARSCTSLIPASLCFVSVLVILRFVVIPVNLFCLQVREWSPQGRVLGGISAMLPIASGSRELSIIHSRIYSNAECSPDFPELL